MVWGLLSTCVVLLVIICAPITMVTAELQVRQSQRTITVHFFKEVSGLLVLPY